MKRNGSFYFLVAALTVLILLPSFLAITKASFNGIFFSIDPDVMYVSNALSFIQNHQIHYFDHPGTPSIILLSLLLTPLRFYTKFLVHTNFIYWSAFHYGIIFFYSRICMLFIAGTGLLILFYAVHKYTKRNFSMFVILLALLAFTPFYYLGTSISAEALSFTLASIWLLLFVHYAKTNNKLFLYILAFLSGFSFANRATSVALGISILALSIFYGGKGFKFKLLTVVRVLLIEILGYYMGLWPISNKIFTVTKVLLLLGGGSSIHGGGMGQVFRLEAFLTSVNTIFNTDTQAVLAFLAVLIICIVSFFSKDSKDRKMGIIGICAGMVAVLFAKFPLIHYQTTNYLVIIFVGSVFISRRLVLSVLFTTIMLFCTRTVLLDYQKSITRNVNKAILLQNYQDSHPASVGTVWEFGKTKNFAILWSRYWGRGLFEDEIQQRTPPLYESENKFRQIEISSAQQKKLFDVCWDQLYLQDSSLDAFLNNNYEKDIRINKIHNTDIDVIFSTHCQVTKP